MTAFKDKIIVLAGEPGEERRNPDELSVVEKNLAIGTSKSANGQRVVKCFQVMLLTNIIDHCVSQQCGSFSLQGYCLRFAGCLWCL